MVTSGSKIDPIEIPYDYCGHQVPGIWRFMLPQEAKQWLLPKESRSTCDECPMSCFKGYHSLYRCCAYHPIVPNFLLGLSLRQAKSRRAVRDLLEAGYLLPEGFQRTPRQWIDYLADLSDDPSEEETKVLCPILDKGTGFCNIYAFRNAVCTTFFCLNDHGQKGQKFWEALEETISHAETALGQWALWEMGFDVEAYFKRLDVYAKDPLSVVDPKTNGWTLEARKHLWQEHFGKEFELLEKCAELISDNRDKLWELAESTPVLDAGKFEKAQVKAVPERYQDEIDPDDLEDTEEGECAKVSDLFKTARKEYKKLWSYPERLVLSPRVRIEKNPKDDKESKAFKKYPYVVKFLKKAGGKKFEWRQFVNKGTAEALKSLKSPKSTKKAVEKKGLGSIKTPEIFFSEWHGKKVLIKPNY